MNLILTTFRHLRFAALHCTMAFALLIITTSTHAVEKSSITDTIIDASQDFLERIVDDYLQRSEIQARHEIQINRLDPRLRLPACNLPLTVILESPAQPVGRTTLRVSCEGLSPWSLFVPAQVRIFRQVVAVTRPVKRNSTLSLDDLTLIERDIGLLNQGYLTDVNQAQGRKALRMMQTGYIITHQQLAFPEAIRKGDQVVITARNSNVAVKMSGQALSSGGVGQQINVKNLRSSRTVKALIVAPGQVEVPM